MPQAWEAAQVAVIPSLWPEPCPLVALEAMRAGTPVVASNVGGLPELIRDGVDGFLVDPGDVRGLRTAVSRLLDAPSLRAHMGAQARERAATTFAPSVVIPKIEALYLDVMARGSH